MSAGADMLRRLDHSVPWRAEMWSEASAIASDGSLIDRGRLMWAHAWDHPMTVMLAMIEQSKGYVADGVRVAETRFYDRSGQRVVFDDGTTP